jgi:sugar phosphate isomerase/epimerase
MIGISSKASDATTEPYRLGVCDAEAVTRRLVSLAAGTILDVGPADVVRVAADAGWPAVGIWFDPATWTTKVATDVAAALASAGTVALDIEPIILVPDGPVVPDDAVRLVDAGLQIGARNVLVASRDPDHARVADAVRRLCEQVEGSTMRIVLEFLPVLAVRTLADALTIVRQVDHPTAGVLVDALHLVRSGGSVDEVAAITATDPDLLPYAQLCDVAAQEPPDMRELLDEALHGRLLPGDGVAPLVQLLDALPAGSPISLELRSRQLMTDYPDPVERARAVLAATKRVLAAHAMHQVGSA